jgi:hypothetical protein
VRPRGGGVRGRGRRSLLGDGVPGVRKKPLPVTQTGPCLSCTSSSRIRGGFWQIWSPISNGHPYCSLFEPTSKKMPSHAGRWPTHRTRSASPAAAGAQRLLAPLHDVPTSFGSAGPPPVSRALLKACPSGQLFSFRKSCLFREQPADVEGPQFFLTNFSNNWKRGTSPADSSYRFVIFGPIYTTGSPVFGSGFGQPK